jgi:hypothetical protein
MEHALVLRGKCVRANMRCNLGQTVPARAGDPTADKAEVEDHVAVSAPQMREKHILDPELMTTGEKDLDVWYTPCETMSELHTTWYTPCERRQHSVY